MSVNTVISYVANWLERGFKEYYANPRVTISVKTSRRNKMSILGEVSNPGIYAIGDKIRLKDALAMAENLTATAEPRSIVMVRGDLDRPQISLLDTKDLTSGNGLEKNVMLDSGDILYVPDRLISNIDTISTCLHTIIRPVPEIESGTFSELASEDTLEAGKKQSVLVVR